MEFTSLIFSSYAPTLFFPSSAGFAGILKVFCLDHCTSLPHLSSERHFLHLTPSVYILDHFMLWSGKNPNRIITLSSHPHPTEILPVLQCLRDAAEDELRRPCAIWNLPLWLLTFHHVAPIACLGCLRHLSWPWQALVIFQDLALAGHRPIGKLAQCLVCLEDWPSFSECSFPVLYKVGLPWQLHALMGGLS